MALVLHLKNAQFLKGRYDRQAKITFRGVSQLTQIVEHCEDEAIWDEKFEWPVASSIEKHEAVEIVLLNHSKFRSNKVVGKFQMVLQQLVEDGQLNLTEPLLDANNTAISTTISLNLHYQAPDGTVGDWMKEDFDYKLLPEDQVDNDNAFEEIIYDVNSLTSSSSKRGSRTSLNTVGTTRSYTSSSTKKCASVGHYSIATTKSTSSKRSRKSVKSLGTTQSIKSIGKGMMGMMKLGKKRRPRDDDSQALMGSRLSLADELDHIGPGDGEFHRMDDEGDAVSEAGFDSPKMSKKYAHKPPLEQASLRLQDFQVSVTVIEARQLAGLNIDPLVCVTVGDSKKYTSVKQSTNCPYFNEYFVFDFHVAPAMLFDKIIKLQVLHSRNVLRAGTVIGQFKFDVGTVYQAPDHMYYHKWAILTDPEDMNGGCKGYLKVDISVVGKGDSLKVPAKVNDDEDDIESNLLLPEGIPAERQMGQFIVKVYKAEGLPIMNSGMLANVKKVFTGEMKDLVDPYVQVNFAGQKARTTVKKHQYYPIWNEQIVFTEMFPPLCRRMKLELRDKDSVLDDIIGTHFVDLSRISNEGECGFLPTFGPSWINLYGSLREYSALDEHRQLNEGLGEGCMYRGRILVAVKAEVSDKSLESGSIGVEVEPALPISDSAAGRKEEFFLFGCVMEAGMMEKKTAEKAVSFEISIGNQGNNMDGTNIHTKPKSFDSSESEEEEPKEEKPKFNSTTESIKPVNSDNEKYYYHMPYNEKKPCVYVQFPWEDHRRRLYNQNILYKIADKLEEGLGQVNEMLAKERPHPEKTFKQVMDDLSQACSLDQWQTLLDASNVSKLTKGTGGTSNAGKTKLDKERHKLILREMEIMADTIEEVVYGPKAKNNTQNDDTSNSKGQKKRFRGLRNKNKYLPEPTVTMPVPFDEDDHMSRQARAMKAGRSIVTPANLKEKMKAAYGFLRKLQHLAQEPQHNVPDVFIWMFSGGKRIAYYRIPARKLLYSIVEEERGTHCGKVQTVFLRLPGKKGTGPAGWTMQCKLQLYLWLGLTKHKKDFLSGLPGGFEMTKEIRQASKITATPPKHINYLEKQRFQLRAHMYQARSLVGSDASGLSDPFTRVVVANQMRSTQVIDETLSPTWDEMLVFDEIVIYGKLEDVLENLPMVVIEVFDQDTVGKSEFIGRALANPVIKTVHDPYERPEFPPLLEWFNVYRGQNPAGELLAAFELLQLPEPGDTRHDASLPPGVPPIDRTTDRGPIIPVPKGIRPNLSKHRIEVLFWGVREMKRLQLTSVDRPRVDVECAGKVVSSTVIENTKKNPNFSQPVKFIEVELPEREIYCPPINIRVVDCRTFGRFTLVGTHVITSIQKFRYIPKVKKTPQRALPGLADNDKEEPQSTDNGPPQSNGDIKPEEQNNQNSQDDKVNANDTATNGQTLQAKPEGLTQQLAATHQAQGSPAHLAPPAKPGDITISMESSPGPHQPLIKESTVISVPTDTPSKGKDSKKDKDSDNKKKKKDDKDGLDESTLDWWSKYFASKEALRKEQQKKQEELAETGGDLDALDLDNQIPDTLTAVSGGTSDGQVPNGELQGDGVSFSVVNETGSNKGDISQDGKKFKTIATGVKIANRLSPKPQRKGKKSGISTLKDEPDIVNITIYPGELEQVPEFNGFREWLHTFELYRGKNTGEGAEDNESRVVGKFKGSMMVYKWPLPDDIEDVTPFGTDPQFGFFQNLPNNDPIHVLVRVYIVKAIDLHPADMNGKADPYLVLLLGKNKVNDKENYISKQLNPTFGKCFEFEATFPQESMLTVQIYDWDLVGVDDLIGESKIDLENRYYSRHRAVCGISEEYAIHGYNTWRDPSKPTQVLAKLCKDFKLDGPHYSHSKVKVADRTFTGRTDIEDENAVPAVAFANGHANGGQGTVQTSRLQVPNLQVPHIDGVPQLNVDLHLPQLHHHEPMGHVTVNGKIFFAPIELKNSLGHKKPTDEHLALEALKHWDEIPKGCKLVPEHVETRPLYNPNKPGIEQGKVEMWVDMFPMDMPSPGAPVDISPRKPKKYELRCIIWNTDDVILEDDAFFTGEKMSDIYVKGWLKGSQDDLQATDIHYRSLTGEGNFNWRFIFPFEYLAAEEKIVISKKESLFSWDESEYKIPPRLNLQVWDADHFSADDFLGAVTLDLNRFPRGAKNAKQCSLDMLKTDGSVPQVSLFKLKRIKGWWPFAAKGENEEETELTGKVEAELHLMSEEEAEKSPAGLGRSDPDPLEKPNRPDTSFVWFLNPLKAFKYMICVRFKWLIIKALISALLIAIVVLFFYAMPGYTVKKMFNV
ncbi:otoferlin-like isoform X9 [Ptychodera flava]|uniref:otoferlin-like isoform X9 n=1 Tax=Ptychodera flava TaxID=63121 RepID=UPI00396A3DB8